MLGKLRSCLTYANVMATVAAFVALGGTAYAVATIGSQSIINGSIRGIDVHNNSITGADVRGLRGGDITDGTLLAKDFKSGQLPAGQKGDKGDKGDRGDSATNLWALVRGDGTLLGSAGVVGTVAHVAGDEVYTITFNQSVANCAAVATPGLLNNSVAGNRIVSTNRGAPSPDKISVRTQRYDAAPGAADFVDEEMDFSLAVFC